jgi:hypothetical protein
LGNFGESVEASVDVDMLNFAVNGGGEASTRSIQEREDCYLLLFSVMGGTIAVGRGFYAGQVNNVGRVHPKKWVWHGSADVA